MQRRFNLRGLFKSLTCDVVLSNVFAQEAILNILEKKGLVTKEEVMEEMKRLMVDDKKRKA